MPARCPEAFGLYVIEALAAGVPVVQPRSGAFPELIEATGGGVLCEPEDPESLAQTLEALLLAPEHARPWAKADAGRCLKNAGLRGTSGCVMIRVLQHTRKEQGSYVSRIQKFVRHA